MAGVEDEMPKFILLPGAQAKVDSDAVLRKAMGGIKESILNALQGVKDGRYKTFEEGVEALTGHRPERVVPPNPPQFGGYFGAVGRDPRGDGYMAIISDGHPKRGGDCMIMDMNRFKTKEEGDAWIRKRVDELPWEERGEMVEVDAP